MIVRFVLMFLVTLLAAGCRPGTPPVETARPVDDRTTVEELPPIVAPKPEKSDPAAAAVVNAILMAHTNSQPSLVEKFKKAGVKRRGIFRLADEQTNASMEIYIWDELYRATYAMEARGNVPNTFSLKGNSGWQLLPQLNPQPTPLAAVDLENVLPDVRGDRMLLLFPLADEKLTAAMAREAKGDVGPIVRVWVGDQPPFLIFADPKTNRLSRISYEGRETGQIMLRTLELHDLEVIAGVLMPKRIDYRVGPAQVTSWTKIDYQVPGTFDLNIFDKP